MEVTPVTVNNSLALGSEDWCQFLTVLRLGFRDESKIGRSC